MKIKLHICSSFIRAWLCCLLILCCWSLNAKAELIVEITQGQDDAVSVGVVPFSWSGAGRMPDDVAAIIESDLHRSGQFKPIARSRMLSLPSQPSQVFFKEWKAVEYLVTGRLSQTGNGAYRVEFELYDTVQKNLIKKGSASGRRLRSIAHYISDIVYEQLSGIKGAFSTRLVYVTLQYKASGQQLFKLHRSDADGYNDVVIMTSSEPILSPSWAPNGRDIAYVSFQGTRPAIYIKNTITGTAQKITGFPGLNSSPAFSPDGKHLAMVLSKDGNPEIYIMNLKSGQLKRLTRHYGIDTEPSWFPDGQSLLFTSDRGGSPQIYKMSLKGGKVERLTFEGNYNARPSLTPDGRYLAFVHRSRGVFHVAVKDLVRGSFSILTETQLDESPSISPNGTMILYATQQQGRGILGAVSMDGRVKVRLPSSQGHVREPAWSPFLY